MAPVKKMIVMVDFPVYSSNFFLFAEKIIWCVTFIVINKNLNKVSVVDQVIWAEGSGPAQPTGSGYRDSETTTKALNSFGSSHVETWKASVWSLPLSTMFECIKYRQHSCGAFQTLFICYSTHVAWGMKKLMYYTIVKKLKTSLRIVRFLYKEKMWDKSLL